ncbi:MAG: acyl-[acyl-carrier-protein] thioesterase [Clostridium sp.]|jgi:acyl-ACP thioesterase|nr:acyl-[acyl-carrier-protein] thioesterase [Clostridium sp.]
MYTFESRIRYSECDSEGSLKFSSLLDYFQDCSTFQSEDLGIGIRFLKERGLVWVLAAWQIVVEQMPHLLDNVVIGTFPHEFKGFLGTRNFFMQTKEGAYLAKANSLWTLINIETGKPVPAPSYILDKYQIEPKLPMNYLPRKIFLPPNGQEQAPFLIKKQHLDTNNHVNNGKYIEMALEYLPDGYVIASMRAEYRKQAWLADEIHPVVFTDEERTCVSLQDAAGNVYSNVEFISKPTE